MSILDFLLSAALGAWFALAVTKKPKPPCSCASCNGRCGGCRN